MPQIGILRHREARTQAAFPACPAAASSPLRSAPPSSPGRRRSSSNTPRSRLIFQGYQIGENFLRSSAPGQIYNAVTPEWRASEKFPGYFQKIPQDRSSFRGRRSFKLPNITRGAPAGRARLARGVRREDAPRRGARPKGGGEVGDGDQRPPPARRRRGAAGGVVAVAVRCGRRLGAAAERGVGRRRRERRRAHGRHPPTRRPRLPLHVRGTHAWR
eukprot:gene3560-biopygen8254